MDVFTASILLILILLPLLGFYFRQSWLKPPLPPSPSSGLPLIGHLHLLGKLPHQSFQALAEKHGPIFSLRFGFRHAVVISSTDLAKEVLRVHDATFASRPSNVGLDIGFYKYFMGGAPYGDLWKQLRRLYSVELLTSKRIDSFLPLRLEELSLMLSGLARAHERNEAVDMRNLLTCFTFNTITRILMNKRYFQHQGEELHGIDSSEASVFKAILVELSETALQFRISALLPSYLRWIDWSVYWIRRLHAKQDQFLQKIIDEHKNEKNTSTSSKDIMDMMLGLLAEDPRGEDIVKAAMTELVSGGTDTSATVIEWALAEILHRAPRVLDKAHDELDAVVGRSRMVDEADLPRLPYLQAIIKENFRLHPPAPLLVPHMPTHESNLAGYRVLGGTTTFVNVYAIGRDPALWDEPLEFRPERFLGSSMDVKGQDFELLPFGSGRRACPGMGLGLRTVQLALANLIHGFHWSAAEENALEEAGGAVIWVKTPLKAMASPRLPVEVLAWS
ncbi:hypothetical protein SELMODRAFT_176221 [Selaginella moellendorffii]|uniref:Cytochrome P450-dependent monooxygenase n=1 Tax=Selaginella moellendorffii TaxID=88036 RepID=D8S1W1_SELML|nr:cytochrome P450 71A1 [Selaginella moellendorffii]EFJ21523.1 hypothetical protein SELMODRAFT_176221 [Selaginella moellendorffii]|eukprot:XP_002977519.1 cytochrome P450 71A1 [Selaginella moellendorffii]